MLFQLDDDYKKFNTTFLNELKVDIIQSSIDNYGNSSYLLQLALHLPCLEVLPELDSKRCLSDVIPGDLLIQGNNVNPEFHQWGLLGPQVNHYQCVF